ncbi:MAG TPA: hypothetical protein GXX75_24175 [Clostridiales bacterium]|nr:hypothetical protein [Clostridiales bacterium]
MPDFDLHVALKIYSYFFLYIPSAGHFARRLELKKFYRSETYDRKNPLHRWMKYFDRNLEKDELKELVEMDKQKEKQGLQP